MEYPFKDLLPIDEVLEREGYYKDWTHLDPEVFYSLTQISEYIKTKGYGVDVRLLIAQLAEHFGLSTVQIVDLANSLSTKHDALKGQFDVVIRDATSGADWGGEIVLARGGKATLGQRLDETTAQLAQTERLKVDKGGVEQIDYTNFNQRTKEMLISAGENGFPVIEEDSVSRSNIVSNSVSMGKTDFIWDTRNLYEGRTIKKAAIPSSLTINRIYTESNFTDNTVLPYIEIEKNATYTILGMGLSNRFSVAFSNSLELGSPIERVSTFTSGLIENKINEITVTNSNGYKYLLIHSGVFDNNDKSFTPNEIKVVQGTQSPLSREKVFINNQEVVLQTDDFVIVDNLYRGHTIQSGSISLSENVNTIYTEPNFDDSVELPYLPIEPNKSYTVKVSLGLTMNRFILAFSNNLEVGSPLEKIVTVTDGSINEYTFTNNGGFKYLLIFAGFWEFSDKSMTLADIDVVEGDVMPDSLPTLIVGGKEVMLMSDTTPENHETFNSRQNSQHYYSDEHPPTHFNNTEEVYAAYDDLMEKSNGYMTRELLGKDDWDNPIYCYNFERPEHRTNYEIDKARIGITSSVHGNERSMVNGLYNFMSDMVLNPYKQEKIERMKSLMNFYVIPIAVPTGFDDNTRTNRNGVNINRNFDYRWDQNSDSDKGSAPASEKETQILQNWMVDKELDQYLDFHRADMHSDNNTASWFVSTNKDDDNEWTIPSRQEYLNVIALLSTRYSQKYEELPNHINFGHANTYGHYPQTYQYANSIGILGTLLEMSEVFTQLSGDQRRLRNTWATDLLGNYLFEVARRYI